MYGNLGVMYIAAVAEALGVEVKVADMRILKDVDVSLIPETDFTGVTATSGEAGYAKAIARALRKRNPRTCLIAGGAHASLAPQDFLDDFHGIVQGEGELVLGGILNHGKAGIIKAARITDLDGLPFPARHLFNCFSDTLFAGEKYGKTEWATTIIWSRGCPYNCLTVDTVVEMPNGSRQISEVKVGDTVIGYDPNTREVRLQKVIASVLTSARPQDILEVEAGGKSVRCTLDHPIYTKRGWIQAKDLIIGDEILTYELHTNEGWLSEARLDTPLLAYPRSRKEKARGTETVFGNWCPTSTSKTVVCGGQVPPQDSHFPRGKISCPEAYESQEPYGKSGNKGEGASHLIKTEVCTCRKSTTATCPRETWQTKNIHASTTRSFSATHAGQESYEESRSCNEGMSLSAVAQLRQSESYGRTLDTSRYRTKQRRAKVDPTNFSFGIPFCRRWQLLDWSLPEWALSKPRFHLQEREEQKSDSLKRGILASSSGQERSRGDGRLSKQEVACLSNLEEGTQRHRTTTQQSSTLACWHTITGVKLGKPSPTYNLETYPDHNFFASGILVHNCHFCSNIHRLPVVYRSPENIAAEFEQVKDAYGVSAFRVEDDNLGVNMPWLRRVLGAIPRDTRLKGHMRADLVSHDVAGQLRAAGFEEIGLGVEACDNRVLKLINKRITEEDCYNAVKLLKHHGLRVRVYFMAGLPGETEETVQKNMAFMKRARPDKWTLSLTQPYPGSKLAEEPERFGARIINPNPGCYWNFAASSLELDTATNEEIMERHDRFKRFLAGEEWR